MQRMAQREEELIRTMYDVGRDTGTTYIMDLALITLHERFGFGEKRIMDFYNAMQEIYDEMNVVAAEDTADKTYAKSVIDRRLQAAVPKDKFCPYDKRYKYDVLPDMLDPSITGKNERKGYK